MQVRRLLKDKNTSYADLYPAIKRDPGFSLAVLKEINKTPRIGQDPIADIGRAIPLLGMSWLEEAVSKLPVITHQDPPDKRKAIFRCYSRALHASHYAQYLAQQRNDHDSNELSSTALMSGIGEMALWINSYEVAQKIQSLMNDGIGQDEASTPCLGLSISELSTALRSHWNLPNLHPKPNWPKDARPQREMGVGLACGISQASEFDWYSQAMQRLYQQAAEYLDTNVEQVIPGLRNVAFETAREIHLLGLPCPAFDILLPPGAKRAARRAKKTTLHQHTKPAQGNSSPCVSAMKIPAPVAKQSSALQRLLERTMAEIQEIAGLQRVAFIAKSQDGHYLSTRLSLDQVENSKIWQFKVEATKRSIFSLLMSKPKAFWMNPGNLVEYGHLIPEQAADSLGTNNFFAISIFVKTKPIGLMYADDGPDDAELDAVRYDKFKQLCQRIANQLK